MKEKITVFYSKKTTAKNPLSPFGDNTFIFESFEATSNLQMFSVMVSHFVLNIPLKKLKKATRTYRRKSTLEEFYDTKLSYMILDIDDVKSEFDKERVIEYFKDFKVILGESKSYNGIDNFNMKGILFTEDIKFVDFKDAVSRINNDLKELCTIDESVTRKATLNAPILKNNILYNNEDGIRLKHVKEKFDNTIKNEYFGESSHFSIEELNKLEADTIDRLCLKVFQLMGYHAIKNNSNGSISFKHPSEIKTPGGYFWFSSSPYTMHHGNSTKTVNIFESVKKLDLGKELMQKELNYDDEFLDYNTDTKTLVIEDRFIDVNDKVKTKIDTFLAGKNGLLSIRSPMGTGKSSIIKHLIDECHDQDMKVLIITNRISVAQDFGKKYGLKIYNKDKYELGDSLVCQFDSLWKFNIRFFDIVIMDEFISLMLHSRSNLSKSSINIAKFFGCFNKKLVIADAFLTGYENFLLENKQTNLHMIDNHYRDNTKLFSYENQNFFVQSLVHKAKDNKITVSSTSLSFINSLAMLLDKQGIKVVTLTADTPDTTKQIIYDLFDVEDHNKWDVLIYSPTLTVGVSNLNNVSHHYHYDSSVSTDVISSLQMIKRTRKAKEVHMFIKEKVNYLKTSYNEIRDEYMSNIGKNLDDNYLFDIDNYGEVRLSPIGKKSIKIDNFKNILEFNHKNAMFWLLKYHFADEPVIVTDKFSGNILNKYQRIIKNNRGELLENNLKQYQELADIDKSIILIDKDADKDLKVIAEIDNEIISTNNELRADIIKHCMANSSFIETCKLYKLVKSFIHKKITVADIKQIISNSIMGGETEDIYFYNCLLDIKENELKESYSIKEISSKGLRYVLSKCGYRMETGKRYGSIGVREFSIDENILKYEPYIS